MINLLAAYQALFGYVGRPKGGLDVGIETSPVNIGNSLPYPEIKQVQESAMGTPLFLPCTLDGVRLPNEPIITITGGKKIIETDFDDQVGTFKEIFSLMDYRVLIEGIAVEDEAQDDIYPEEIVRQIRKLCEKRTHLKVTNDLCTLFNITHLVIYDFDFPRIPGEIGVQGYTLKCKSDKPLSLEVQTDEN